MTSSDMGTHPQICPKWPWSTVRSDASKVVTVLIVIYGSICYGWMFSLVGEKLVAKVSSRRSHIALLPHRQVPPVNQPM